MNKGPLLVEKDRILIWDGWRGMAILMVLCGHFFDIKWLWEDRMGVDVFFVLSGMLMSGILFEKRMSLRDFYIRRFSRIYPAFLVFVLSMFAVGIVFAIDFKWSELVASLFFLRTYLPADPGIWSSGLPTGHLWSLNVEEHAYLFLSAVTLFLVDRKYIAVALLLVALGTVVLSFYYYFSLAEPEFKLYLIRTESAVVFILFSAGYGLLTRKYNVELPSIVPFVCLLLALVCYANAAPDWLIFTACPVLLGVTVNHLKNLPALVSRLLTNPVIRYFGLWSYSIYLWQQFFYEYSWRIPGGKLVALALAILIGVASYYLLEQPARRWINTRWSSNASYKSGN